MLFAFEKEVDQFSFAVDFKFAVNVADVKPNGIQRNVVFKCNHFVARTVFEGFCDYLFLGGEFFFDILIAREKFDDAGCYAVVHDGHPLMRMDDAGMDVFQ